jgi:hypothetical protein
VRDPKIGNLGITVPGQQYVLRFNVPMNDAFGVKFRQSLTDAGGQLNGLLQRELPLPRQQILQAAEGQVLHNGVQLFNLDTKGINPDHIGMLQGGGEAGL